MKSQRLIAALVGLVGCLLLISCGGRTEGHATDTKTNWLARCADTSDCDDGLACLCGVCTVGCDDDGTCEPFTEKAGCYHAECAPGGGVCALLETPLAGKHPEGPDECPRADERYLHKDLALCEQAAIDCSLGFQEFKDECGCGCEPNPACDPEVSYVAHFARCEFIEFDCDEDGEMAFDECGCGCRETKTPDVECAEDPYTYLGTVEQCKTTDFDANCLAGSWFEDECGCGCLLRSDCDETTEYAAFGELCQLADFFCPEGQEYASDECGCGCRPVEAPPCSHDESEYVGFGEACDLLDFACDAGDGYFRDECGCGCAPNPACDPAIAYVVAGGCDGVDYQCKPGEVYASDECGCGCAPNPMCDPAVDYIMYGGCAGALFGCDEGEQIVIDACGCGCSAATDTSDDETTCRTPDGAMLETELLTQVACTTSTNTDRIVRSQAELDAALTSCVTDAASQLTYAGAPLYLQTVATREAVRHVYTVATDSGIRVGVKYPVECGAQAPDQSLLVFKIEGLDSDQIVQEYVCNSEACPE